MGVGVVIVSTQHGYVLLTDHAIARFRLRVDGKATAGSIAAAVREAKVSRVTPAWAVASEHQDAWLVGDAWACPLRLPGARDRNPTDFDYAALTCIVKRRRSKEQVRMWREQMREGWAA